MNKALSNATLVISFCAIATACAPVPVATKFGIPDKVRQQIPQDAAVLVFIPGGKTLFLDADGNAGTPCSIPEPLARETRTQREPKYQYDPETTCLGLLQGAQITTFVPEAVLFSHIYAQNPHKCWACWTSGNPPQQICVPTGCRNWGH